MTSLIVESPLDPDLYAVIGPTSAGEVFVRICRRSGWRPATARRIGGPIARLLGEMTVDAPLHLVADRVHDLLMEMDR